MSVGGQQCKSIRRREDLSRRKFLITLEVGHRVIVGELREYGGVLGKKSIITMLSEALRRVRGGGGDHRALQRFI